MSDEAILVVGGDSLVGGGVIRHLKSQGRPVFATTRRPDTLDGERLLLDFERPEEFDVPEQVGSALVIAAATNYDFCETDPMARVINVEMVPRTVAALLDRGLHVTFISTNSVFGGDRPWPHEDDPHSPGIAYARQKSECEAAIRSVAQTTSTADRLCITRLTKILSSDTSPIPAWRAIWERGEDVEPFEDLVFAPMSVDFVSASLARIAELKIAGNLHLSGAENVDYTAFAEAIARRIGVDPSRVRPTTSKAKGVHIAFLPTYSGLGMTRTTPLTGIEPQPLDAAIADIFPV
ncbi:sugar nucleotide-binding protein [Pontivivens ytuae]|uniref:dTDP-4-dehydrorhamnose reductase n=1 Tax=Pontivivens ytuae TaxID=2789856 RepID=A0A7S9LNY9_9RHOB|nr:sugar nucleotide-binding protein [Pontivivens ytuae]QPH52604.1 sugar nucleotide-binding protein [Pontivivens ytuae]